MSAFELMIDGPQEVGDGIVKYTVSDLATSEEVLGIERISRPDNKCATVNWNPNYDLGHALRGINQVWVGKRANLFVSPSNKSDIVGYEMEVPLEIDEIHKLHPRGLKWLRVETPDDPMTPDLFVPFQGRVRSLAGIIIAGEPPHLEWRYFQPLYQQTAEKPYNLDRVRQALTSTGIEIV